MFYLWLYARPEGFVKRYLYYGAIDAVRGVASRLPPSGAKAIARLAAHAARTKYRLAGRRVDQKEFDELVIGLLDTLTPRWRHYHTPVEVARWFFEAGFGAPTVTHWDNAYGFGVVAAKCSPGVTPARDSTHCASAPQPVSRRQVRLRHRLWLDVGLRRLEWDAYIAYAVVE